MKSTIKAIRFFISIVMLVTASNCSQAQLIVDTSQTPQQLVQDVLLGPGVTATNIHCNCPPRAFGFFNGSHSNIGIPAGVILTTGEVFTAVGPNDSDDAGIDAGVMYMDSQLTSIEPTAIYDPCILEFDFVPDSSHVEFKYVFGSEEYNEFVDQGYNDAFGFFLTGPGISNPNNNIALVPSTTVPITIDHVDNGYNIGCPSTGPCRYCQYYFDNCGGTTVQYDGFTTVLTAQANVTQGQTYHIKLAIADASDGIYDSGVFLQCGSFSSRKGTSSPCSTVITSSENPEENSNAYFFPNPVSDLLTLTLPNNISNGKVSEITIGDMTGKELHSMVIEKSGNTFSIPTAGLNNGVYFLRITSGTMVQNEKFVVVHN